MDNKRNELFSVTIEISPGKEKSLHIYENDDPEIIAKEFVISYSLNKSFIQTLSQ